MTYKNEKILFKKTLDNPGCSQLILDTKGKKHNPIIIVADQSGKITFHDSISGILINNFTLECKTEVWSIELLDISGPDANEFILFSGSAAGMIYAYQLSINLVNEDKNEDLQKIPVNVEYSLLWKQKTNDMISKLELFDVNSNGKQELVVSSLDHTIRVLNPLNGGYIWGQVFQSGINTFKCGSVYEDGKTEVIVTSVIGAIRIFNGKTGELRTYSRLPNNIRTIDIIQVTDSLKRSHFPDVDLKFKKILVCGCDDSKIYLINPIDCSVLAAIDQESYIWFSGINPVKMFLNGREMDSIYFSTYTFDFMEGLVIFDKKVTPSLKFLNLDDLELISKLDDINIHAISNPMLIKNNGENSTAVFFLGTTDKTIDLIDLSTGIRVFSKNVDTLVNCVTICERNNKLLLSYCGENNQFVCLEIS